VVGCITLTLMRPLLRHEPDSPPVIAELPDFRLIDQDGVAFDNRDLGAGVWVVGFFCTRCPEDEPSFRALLELAARYDESGVERIGLLAISADPEHDTPEKLAAWRRNQAPGEARLRLLGGDLENVTDLLREGFGLSGDRPSGSEARGRGRERRAQLVLIDPEGGIRGYYATDEMGLEEVFHRSRHVLRDSPAFDGGAAGPVGEVW
jgi:protein SCO1/2